MGGEGASLCPWWGVPRHRDTSVPNGTAAPAPGARDFPGHIYHEMTSSLFADLLQELEGAEKWIVGWWGFLCVKAVKLLCRAGAVNEVCPAV